MEFADKKLDGSRIASEIREEVAAEVAILLRRGVIPRLDAVLVGEDPASKVYPDRPPQRRFRGRWHPCPAAVAGHL